MSLSLKFMVCIAIYYILLGTILGVLGQNIAYDSSNVNTSLEEFQDYNTTTEISVSGISSFFTGLYFSISNMPWYITVFLSVIIPVIVSFCVIWLIRGNG